MAVVHEPDFGAARDLFALYCKAKGLSVRTLETYLASIDELGTFLAQSGRGGGIPLPQDIRAFVASLLDRSLARTTISIRLRSVRCFFNFLAREEVIGTSPMASVEIPRLPTRYPEVLTEAEIKAILAAARQRTWTATRNRTMLLLLLDTGVRLGELIGLDLGDLDLHAARVRVRNGKGERERYVFVGRTLLRSLRTWLDTRGTGQESWPLFVTRGGGRLDRRNVQRILERISAKAGLAAGRVSPHRLRHTFATHYIMNGGDPFSLQRILGHSDIKTTMIYVNLAGVGLREAHAKASPIDRILQR